MRRTLLMASLIASLTSAARNLPAQPPPDVPGTWGPSAGYTTIMNYRLQGTNSIGAPYTLFHQGGAGTSCHGDPSAECLGYAQIEAPEGARLDLLGIWGYDDSVDSDLHYVVLQNCESIPGSHTETVIAQADVSQSGGDFLAAGGFDEDVTVDNQRCAYTVRLRLTDPGDPPAGLAIRIRKMAVVWHRQVSPAPAAATFADVPTSHPFFQFVEALSRSGITAGCGGDDFCPDAPLTRGQMAVFLAKALGLQWPLPESE
jgi:S-layer homology domain